MDSIPALKWLGRLSSLPQLYTPPYTRASARQCATSDDEEEEDEDESDEEEKEREKRDKAKKDAEEPAIPIPNNRNI